MDRLCERPGCSEIGALAYGMRAEELVFWVDVLREGASGDTGVLCQRHGDSMTVPRGWTLDDQRVAELHLFRSPPRTDAPAARRNRAPRRGGNGDETGQLALSGVLEDPDLENDVGRETELPDPETVVPVADVPVADVPVVDDARHLGALAWKPAFDDGDDLDGLLAARSPLLSRAFRGERS